MNHGDKIILQNLNLNEPPTVHRSPTKYPAVSVVCGNLETGSNPFGFCYELCVGCLVVT
jgi:hypothetical protein